jgi:2-oxoglutarate ferredoxin oxidoreductase subunit beta
MAPTTLCNQKTTTTPSGRKMKTDGYPLHVSELLATIEGTSYIARTAVNSYKNVMDTREAIEKSFRYQIEGKGFSLVEILSPCPVDWKLSPKDSLIWIQEEMIPVYPLGTYRDI